MPSLIARACALGFALSTAALAAQTVTVEVPNCDEALHAYRFNGVQFVRGAALDSIGAGTFTLPNDRVGIAYVGPASGGAIPLYLDGEEDFTVTGNCKKMSAAVITGSPANDAYVALKRESNALVKKGQQLARTLATRTAGTPDYEATKADLKANDDAMLARLAELREAGEDFFASVLAVNAYTSFANTQKGYGQELTYFVNERFQHADFSDPVYAGNPWVFEAYREFASALVQANVPEGMLDESLNQQLDLVYNHPPVHKLALGGVIAALGVVQHPMQAAFAKQYVKRYGEQEPEAAAKLEADAARLGAFARGAVAPAFEQMLLDSSGTAGPQDFRGKVLLIDFWASWCGPCRRENPNVVAMYNEHKGAGFDILGVSLDRRHGPWRAAVEKDGLAWTHVSDLRGWQNAVAQQYGVRSVPATVLLDREGRIVARDLRGAALEAKVAELLAAEEG